MTAYKHDGVLVWSRILEGAQLQYTETKYSSSLQRILQMSKDVTVLNCFMFDNKISFASWFG